MEKSSLKDIFEQYRTKNDVFMDKEILSIRFSPDDIPHRDGQIKQIALMLAPVIRNQKPSNIFIYGKTGTGKTLVIKNIITTLEQTASKNNVSVKIIYINWSKYV